MRFILYGGPELKLQVFTYCDKDPVNEYEQQRKELPEELKKWKV